MPVSVAQHLKDFHNQCRLIVIASTQLDERDCYEALRFYGSVKNVELTIDRLAAFVDFECPHAPLLIARCFEYYKNIRVRVRSAEHEVAEMPMPRGATVLLPGCSIGNYLYLQHIPRALSTANLRAFWVERSNRSTVTVHRPGPACMPSSRAVVHVAGTEASLFHRGQMRHCTIGKCNSANFYVIPFIPELTDNERLFDTGGCAECNTTEFTPIVNFAARAEELSPSERMHFHLVEHFPVVAAAPPAPVAPPSPKQEQWIDLAETDEERWKRLQREKEREQGRRESAPTFFFTVPAKVPVVAPAKPEEEQRCKDVPGPDPAPAPTEMDYGSKDCNSAAAGLAPQGAHQEEPLGENGAIDGSGQTSLADKGWKVPTSALPRIRSWAAVLPRDDDDGSEQQEEKKTQESADKDWKVPTSALPRIRSWAAVLPRDDDDGEETRARDDEQLEAAYHSEERASETAEEQKKEGVVDDGSGEKEEEIGDRAQASIDVRESEEGKEDMEQTASASSSHDIFVDASERQKGEEKQEERREGEQRECAPIPVVNAGDDFISGDEAESAKKEEELDSDDLLSGDEDKWFSVPSRPNSRNSYFSADDSSLPAMEEESKKTYDAPSLAMMAMASLARMKEEQQEQEARDAARAIIEGMIGQAIGFSLPSPTVSLAHQDNVSRTQSPTLSLDGSSTVSLPVSPTVSIEGSTVSRSSDSPPLVHEDTESSREASTGSDDDVSSDDTQDGYETASEDSTLTCGSVETVVGEEGFFADPEEWDEADRMAYGIKKAVSPIAEEDEEQEEELSSRSDDLPTVPTAALSEPPTHDEEQQEQRSEGTPEAPGTIRCETRREGHQEMDYGSQVSDDAFYQAMLAMDRGESPQDRSGAVDESEEENGQDTVVCSNEDEEYEDEEREQMTNDRYTITGMECDEWLEEYEMLSTIEEEDEGDTVDEEDEGDTVDEEDEGDTVDEEEEEEWTMMMRDYDEEPMEAMDEKGPEGEHRVAYEPAAGDVADDSRRTEQQQDDEEEMEQRVTAHSSIGFVADEARMNEQEEKKMEVEQRVDTVVEEKENGEEAIVETEEGKVSQSEEAQPATSPHSAVGFVADATRRNEEEKAESEVEQRDNNKVPGFVADDARRNEQEKTEEMKVEVEQRARAPPTPIAISPWGRPSTVVQGKHGDYRSIDRSSGWLTRDGAWSAVGGRTVTNDPLDDSNSDRSTPTMEQIDESGEGISVDTVASKTEDTVFPEERGLLPVVPERMLESPPKVKRNVLGRVIPTFGKPKTTVAQPTAQRPIRVLPSFAATVRRNTVEQTADESNPTVARPAVSPARNLPSFLSTMRRITVAEDTVPGNQ